MAKCAVITGGSRGIGRAAVERFARDGYDVYFTWNSSCEQADSLENEYNNVTAFHADVSSADEMKDFIDSVYKKCGRIDVCICNAGVASFGVLGDLKPCEWNRIFAVNTNGVFNTVSPLYDIMVGQKSGRIITVSSIFGQTGGSCEVAYSASKAAVIGFTKALAKELAPSGVTVNCISPGVIDTEMNSRLSPADKSELIEEIPLLRMGTPSDIAGVMAFLASDDAEYITGQVIACNGGMYI